jgi:hypothetical protein
LSKWIVYEGQKWQPSEKLFPVFPNSPLQSGPYEMIMETSTDQPISNVYPLQSKHSVPISNLPKYQEEPPVEKTPRRKILTSVTSESSSHQPVSFEMLPTNRGTFNNNYTQNLALKKSDSNQQSSTYHTSTFSFNLPPNYETTPYQSYQYGPMLGATQAIPSKEQSTTSSMRTKPQELSTYDDKKSNTTSKSSSHVTSVQTPLKQTTSDISTKMTLVVPSPAIPESAPTMMLKPDKVKTKHRLSSLFRSKKEPDPPLSPPQVFYTINGSSPRISTNSNGNFKIAKQTSNAQASAYQNKSPLTGGQTQKEKPSSRQKKNRSTIQLPNNTKGGTRL